MAITTNSLTGNWASTYSVPYANASIWGTGINPLHSEYGEGNPLRVSGRNDDQPEVQPPAWAQEGFVELESPWGYTTEDSAATPFIKDGWPDWTEPTTATRAAVDNGYPPYNATGKAKGLLRSIYDGARKANYKTADSLPNETVSEGWVNKPKDGKVANARTSDPSQYEMQTSMTQRYKTRDNGAAVERATDVARATIESRVAPQKVKHYSEGERHYDMFPQQQTEIQRPFLYRTFGSGPQENMLPNETTPNTPIQRVPPPDPSLGVTETDATLDYGYTDEDDQFYLV